MSVMSHTQWQNGTPALVDLEILSCLIHKEVPIKRTSVFYESMMIKTMYFCTK